MEIVNYRTGSLQRPIQKYSEDTPAKHFTVE